jgi:hypothetical protein
MRREIALHAELFNFQWKVDLDGYEVRIQTDEGFLGGSREIILPRGQRWSRYRALQNPGLWLRFAETCRDRPGLLGFIEEFGMLGDFDTVYADLLLAERLHFIAEHVKAGDRDKICQILQDAEAKGLWEPPRMHVTLISQVAPKLAVVPELLQDALKLQALQAIESVKDWQFQKCRNPDCGNYLKLGRGSGDRTAYTARRAFCSDRCRVAYARQQKRQIAVPAS